MPLRSGLGHPTYRRSPNDRINRSDGLWGLSWGVLPLISACIVSSIILKKVLQVTVFKLEGYFFSEPPTIFCSMADVFVVVTVSCGVSLIGRRRHGFRPFHPIHLFKCTNHFSWSDGHVEFFISRRRRIPSLFVALFIIVSVRVKTKISTLLPFRTAICGSQVVLLLISWLICVCSSH